MDKMTLQFNYNVGDKRYAKGVSFNSSLYSEDKELAKEIINKYIDKWINNADKAGYKF